MKEIFNAMEQFANSLTTQPQRKEEESCSNCKFDSECRHKPVMPEGVQKCKFYIQTKSE